MPIHPKEKIIFIHIPKAAGTSVEIAMGSYGLNNSGDNAIFCPSILFGRTFQHMTFLEIEKVMKKMGLDPRCYASLCVVRHPASRMASEFKWRKSWDEKISDWPFQKFCEHFLKDTKVHEMNFINRHFVCQKSFLGPNTRVFKQEYEMKALESTLRKKGALKKIEIHNTSPRDDQRYFWDNHEECLEMIKSVYLEDYKEFQYDEHPWSHDK